MKQSSTYGLISALSLAFALALHTNTIEKALGADAYIQEGHLKLQAIDSCLGTQFNPAAFSSLKDKDCVEKTMQTIKEDNQRWRDFSALILLMGAILSAGVAASTRTLERKNEADNNGPHSGF